MPKKLLSLLRRPAVILLLAAELLVLGGALAVALRPAVTYEFAADAWKSIAQTSQISTDENGFVGVSEMTDGEDILRTPSMVLPAGHYIVTVDYNYIPSVWEGGVERRSCIFFQSEMGGTGEKAWLNVKKGQDTVTLNIREDCAVVRLVAHNDGGIFTLGAVRIVQDMRYARACVWGWLAVFLLLDAFLLLVVPGSLLAGRDRELNACMFVLIGIVVLTCAPLLQDNGGTQGSDWAFHLSRIEGIAQGLREGQFPVRIYSMAKDGYGYAPSLFYGELLLYFPAVLRLLGMSVQGAYHTFVLAVQLLTAGISFFAFRQLFRHNKIALVGTVLYMLSTYHFYKIYWLSAVGEFSAMAFLPLIPAALTLLYGEEPPTKQQGRTACIELTAAFGMLVQVHVLTLEMAVLATGVFCLVNFRRTFSRPVLLTWLKAAASAVLLNLWFLLPFFTVLTSGNYSGMYVSADGNGGTIIKAAGLKISELLGWQKDHNNLGPELFIGAAALVWCWLALPIRGKETRRELHIGLWAVAFGVLACWMSTNTFPWQTVGALPVLGRVLTAIQFPGRYLTLATLLFIVAALAGLSLLRRLQCGRAAAAVLLSASVLGAALFIRDYQSGLDPVYLSDGGQLIYAQYKNSNMAWFFDDLYLPDGAQESRDGFVSETVVTTLENVEITQQNGVTTLICAETSGQTQHVELPLLYYPGYTVTAGQGTVFKTPNGLVGVAVPAGFTGSIQIAFREPKRWLLADMVSLATLAALVVRTVYLKHKKK